MSVDAVEVGAKRKTRRTSSPAAHNQVIFILFDQLCAVTNQHHGSFSILALYILDKKIIIFNANKPFKLKVTGRVYSEQVHSSIQCRITQIPGE